MFRRINRILNWELKLETFEVEIPKWNVKGKKPLNDDILYVLLQTYEENGHIYLNNELGYKIAGTSYGMHFRFIMFWLINHKKLGVEKASGKALLREEDLKSTCGDRFCLREGHTKDTRDPSPKVYEHSHTKVPEFVKKSSTPTKHPKKEMMFTKEEANERRLKCLSRKIWLSEEEVPQALQELGGKHRGYKCKLGCAGFHTSSKAEVPKNILRRRNRSMPY